MRVAVLHGGDDGLAHGDAVDAVAVQANASVVAAVVAACRELGHDAAAVEVPRAPAQAIEAVRGARADVAFNLVESWRGEARLESAFAALLEALGIPFTGSGSATLALALDKFVAKTLFLAHAVPVPAAVCVQSGAEPLDGVPFPAIVKPVREDASHGIALESVVRDEAAARARARLVAQRYAQPALVEEFVDGRELNVSILGSWQEAQVLPLGEIDFDGFPAGQPRVVTYAAKWVEDSEEYRGSPSIPARPLEPRLEARVREVALAAFRALGLRDYGRVDLRLHRERGPLVLEVNPNPDLSPDAGFARAAARAGIGYVGLIGRLLEAARARRPARAP
jgi:D-alanine-D-alanine ligase